MREFVGKAAFVTGGASGIGLALGRAFAEAGCKVMLADIEKPALDAAVADLSSSEREIRGIVCDVADPASVDAAAEATFSAFGKVHILCNNAGVGALGGIDHILALGSGRESDRRRQWGASLPAPHASAW
jgi:NAD(P)-dependent dehydrogenase (short-subunit alcohol dehydrogenase family)